MRIHGLLAMPLVIISLAGASAQAQGMGPAPSGPTPGGQQAMPPPPTLTSKDVERLLKLLPEVAKVSAQSKLMQGGMPMNPNEPPPPEFQKIEKMLKADGLTPVEFVTQMSVLVSTYLALSPEAFDKQMPSESSPEVRRVLDDPKVPQEQKDQLRQQVKMIQQNKEAVRAQLTQLATEENKKAVKPYLAKVKAVLDEAQAQANKSAAAAGAAPAPALATGPRR